MLPPTLVEAQPVKRRLSMQYWPTWMRLSPRLRTRRRRTISKAMFIIGARIHIRWESIRIQKWARIQRPTTAVDSTCRFLWLTTGFSLRERARITRTPLQSSAHCTRVNVRPTMLILSMATLTTHRRCRVVVAVSAVATAAVEAVVAARALSCCLACCRRSLENDFFRNIRRQIQQDDFENGLRKWIDGGGSFQLVQQWARNVDFSNRDYNAETVVISGHSTRRKLRCVI